MTNTGNRHDGTGTTAPAAPRPILNVAALRAGYGPIEVLHGMDFTVGAGEIVVILGANGAGKTTTMRCVSGMIERGERSSSKGTTSLLPSRMRSCAQGSRRSPRVEAPSPTCR